MRRHQLWVHQGGCLGTPRRVRVLTLRLFVLVSMGCHARPERSMLARELARMGVEDQAMQFEPQVNPFDDGHDARMDEAYRRNAVRLRQILETSGWPTAEQVGAEAAKSAFLIVQHADHDPALQKRALVLMKRARHRGHRSPCSQTEFS